MAPLQRHLEPLELINQETAGLAVVVCDEALPDCPIIYCSPEFELHSGYKREELLGRNCRMMQGPETEQAAKAAFSDAILNNKSALIEITNYRKDGSKFRNSVLLRPLPCPKGENRLFLAVQNVVDS